MALEGSKISSPALDYQYQYAHRSDFIDSADYRGLRLATFEVGGVGSKDQYPFFFSGQLRSGKIASLMLHAVSRVVRTHFFLPSPGMLDPVVTCSDGVVRFEGFSGCCGVYVQARMSDSMFDQPIVGCGTTNVDFNQPMIVALNRLRTASQASLSIGCDRVSLSIGDSEFVEKKVKLPLRWIRSFGEATVYASQLTPKFRVSGLRLNRFLKSISRQACRNSPGWVVPTANGLRLSLREANQGVRVLGPSRLRFLIEASAIADEAMVWANDDSGVSGWQLRIGGGELFMMLSPDVFRGFSGEGQLLERMAAPEWLGSIDLTRATLRWERVIDPKHLAAESGLSEQQIVSALSVLGARGVAGFDIADQAYFHRELPFDLAKVEMTQSRLINARKLLDRESVRQRGTADSTDFLIASGEIEYLVRLNDDQDSCSCPWHSKYLGHRGPCKHILAAQMFANDSVRFPDQSRFEQGE